MTAPLAAPSTTFAAPDDRTATEPPEHRGLRPGRGPAAGRLARPASPTPRFRDLPDHLRPGDLLVVNTSATLPAELDGRWRDGRPVVVHLATDLRDGTWVAELRTAPDAAAPILDADGRRAGPAARRRQAATAGAVPAAEFQPHRVGEPAVAGADRRDRARSSGYLYRHGRPIAYGYLRGRFPLADYQTMFATDPGSAEMPSAGKTFHRRTGDPADRRRHRRSRRSPCTPGCPRRTPARRRRPEWFEVPASTAGLVTATRRAGGRVIAVGTTVTRALESAVGADGTIAAATGWTDLVIEPGRGVRVVDGLITGWHNPEASHLLLVEAVAGARADPAGLRRGGRRALPVARVR